MSRAEKHPILRLSRVMRVISVVVILILIISPHALAPGGGLLPQDWKGHFQIEGSHIHRLQPSRICGLCPGSRKASLFVPDVGQTVMITIIIHDYTVHVCNCNQDTSF